MLKRTLTAGLATLLAVSSFATADLKEALEQQINPATKEALYCARNDPDHCRRTGHDQCE